MKLRTKFSFLTCTLTVAVVLGVSVFLYIAEKQLLIKEMKETQKNIVHGLSEVSKESLITSNEILLINYINKIKETRGMKYAMLTSMEGEIKVHTDADFIGSTIKKPLEIIPGMADEVIVRTYNDEKGDEISVISKPILVNNTGSGIVWIGFSQAVLNGVVDETLRKTKKRILGVASFGLILGIIGAIILSIMMTKPIRKMAEGAQLIGSGKLGTVIDVKSKDELGNLARDLNKMAKKLAELDQMKQDFVSSITHEFRSPLNAMGIHFDLLAKGHLGELNEKQKDAVGVLKKNALRLGMFIDDLLDMAKIERGKMVINSRGFKLVPVINEIRDFYKVQADKKKISLKTEVKDGLPEAYGDPDRIRQIFTNLLNNAIKFTPENGVITISAELSKDNGIKMAVKDTGMGIPEDQVDSIFNKFEQVKGVREKVYGQKGTGLGLAIVKGLVEGQAGKIWVESEYGKGTVFYFTLPVNKDTANG
ncbi:MAG: HAMP domain-containing sensor histidine kinase [Elusimicrobiota bacterium]